MRHQCRRMHARKQYDTPVRFEMIDGGGPFESKIVNFGLGGLCLESLGPLEVNSLIDIRVVEPDTEADGPGSYYGFLGEVRWCKEFCSNKKTSFQSGVQFMTRNKEMPNKQMKVSKFTCNLCGDFSLTRHMREASDHVFLCPHCYRNFQAMPQGGIKSSIERFLAGNVL